jgi:hypothetical protein
MTDRPNVLGRANALTVMSAVKPRGVVPLRILFAIGIRFPILLTTLKKLSFIHFARWTLMTELPAGRGGAPKPLKNVHLFFESNFNGTWEQYIDAFSYVVPKHIRAIWASSYGFPGPLPAHPFKRYITQHEYPAEHYYSAYPEASTTMVLDALALRADLDRLRRRARKMSPEKFDRAWREFLTANQRRL